MRCPVDVLMLHTPVPFACLSRVDLSPTCLVLLRVLQAGRLMRLQPRAVPRHNWVAEGSSVRVAFIDGMTPAEEQIDGTAVVYAA